MKTHLSKKYSTLLSLVALVAFPLGSAAQSSSSSEESSSSSSSDQPHKSSAYPSNESTGEYIDDATVTTKVKTALVKDDVVKARQIKVTTTEGVVAISGVVDSSEQKDRAEVLARRVNGVKDVRNNLSVAIK